MKRSPLFKAMLKGLAAAILAALISVSISFGVTIVTDGTLGPIALSLAIICPLLIGGPMSTLHFYMHQRARIAHDEKVQAHKELEAMHHELHRLHSELIERSRRDALTGILNREAFMKELAAFADDENAGALFIIDADHFKAINDTFGHLEGDVVLKALTHSIAEKLPEGALFGRVGGEEFAVLFAALSTHAAYHHAENIRLNVETLKIRSSAGTLIDPTISLGGVLVAGRFKVSDAMRVADANLYSAKNDGRNKTVIGNIALARAS